MFFGDKRVGLAKKEFDIVELLSQNPGQVFDKERIYERNWGYDSEGDSSVEMCIRDRQSAKAAKKAAAASGHVTRRAAQFVTRHPVAVLVLVLLLLVCYILSAVSSIFPTPVSYTPLKRQPEDGCPQSPCPAGPHPA